MTCAATTALPPWFEPDRWIPDPATLGDWRISGLLRRTGCDDLAALHARAVADPAWFYATAFDDLGLEWMRPYARTLDVSRGPEWATWFEGGATNLAWLAGGRWAEREPERTAIRWEGEDGGVRSFTYAELEQQVAAAAAGLRHLGVGRGDVVALYLPMTPEAAVALLAAARIGAVAAPAFSGYGAAALAERLRLSRARVLVTADGYPRRGTAVDALAVAREAVRAAPAVEHVVVVERLNAPRRASARESSWEALLAHGSAGAIEPLDPETPFLVAFTSGTTGRPKGAVHVHGGLPYRWSIDIAYGLDVRPADGLCWLSDMGWILGPLAVVGALTLGATLVLLESFDHPTSERLWEQVERHRIAVLGLSPSLVRMLAADGDEPVARHDLTSLRTLATGGEPMTLAAWRWLHRVVGGGRVPIVNASGGTEAGGSFLSGSPIVATPACRFAGPTIGVDVDAVDADGRPVTGTVGELAVRAPWPSMTRGFWGEGPQRYLDAYWSRWEGVWAHGDQVVRHADGSWELPGRADDVLNVAGKRVGPLELESVAGEVDGVADAMAVGVPDERKGEVAVVVVALAPGAAEADVVGAVEARIVAALGKPLRPAAVIPVAELPRLRSGKPHRRAARAWLTGAEPGDLSTLANPAAREAITRGAARWRTSS
ncbi:AMP-binding protein [Conexibacter arvalis]|uniref:acetate--CoA ligase n=1 Tax=Conexibacter arvalis TaxID=912552 RepID=A0A840I873_9ACTN|nr:AMP-binding protein [Conexibacter arvalis]MBB4660525.1 acetyl-CoA synthetase [Conexibacter arvalis]